MGVTAAWDLIAGAQAFAAQTGWWAWAPHNESCILRPLVAQLLEEGVKGALA
jgi:hypothetical protein